MSREKVEIVFIVLVFSGFPIFSFIFSALNIPAGIFTGFYHSLCLLFALLILIKNTKAVNIIFLFFWLLYLLRIIYDISIGDIFLSDRLSIIGYFFYAFAGTFIPALAATKISYRSILKSSNTIFYILLISISFGILKNFISSGLIFNLGGRFEANEFLQTIYYGHYAVSLILLAFSKLDLTKIRFFKFSNYLYICSIFIGILAVGQASSRSPIFALFISLFLFFIFRKVSITKKIFFFVVLIPVLIYQGGSIVEYSKSYGFETLVTRSEKTLIEGDVSARDLLFIDGIDMFLDNPIIGEAFLLQKGIGKGYYPHNFFVDTLISGGIILFFLFTTIIFIVGSSSLKMLKKNEVSWLGMFFIQYFLLGMASGALWSSKIFWVIVGLILSMKSNNK